MGSGETRKRNSLYLTEFLSTFYVCEFARENLHVETDVSRNLSEPESEVWEDYRSHHWRSASRGRIFSKDFEIGNFSVPMHLDDKSSRELGTVVAR